MSVHACKVCLKTFEQPDLLTQHMQQHDVALFAHECNICSHRFLRRDGLQQHMLAKHPVDGKPQFPCDFCERMFRHRASLLRHVKKTHPKEHATGLHRRKPRRKAVPTSGEKSEDGPFSRPATVAKPRSTTLNPLQAQPQDSSTFLDDLINDIDSQDLLPLDPRASGPQSSNLSLDAVQQELASASARQMEPNHDSLHDPHTGSSLPHAPARLPHHHQHQIATSSFGAEDQLLHQCQMMEWNARLAQGQPSGYSSPSQTQAHGQTRNVSTSSPQLNVAAQHVVRPLLASVMRMLAEKGPQNMTLLNQLQVALSDPSIQALLMAQPSW